MKTTIIGTKHFGGFNSGLGVGAEVVDDMPSQLRPVLKSIRRQDVFDHLGSKAMASTTPKRSQPKLRVAVHRWPFQQTLVRVEKLANKGVVQLGLPFLDEEQVRDIGSPDGMQKEGLGPTQTDSAVRAKSEEPTQLGRADRG